MKKLIILLCFILCLPLLFACEKPNPIAESVSELRSEIYVGESESYELKAFYGYRETPYEQDGVKNKTVYNLKIKLLNKALEPATYTLRLNYGETEYKQDFSADKITGNLEVNFQIDNFNVKEFEAYVACAEQTQKVAMKSIVSEKCITYLQALDYLVKAQPDLIAHYTLDDKFCAEIYMRVTVKDEKPYWFVGIASDNGLKAFLIDGLSGELLAIRSVF